MYVHTINILMTSFSDILIRTLQDGRPSYALFRWEKAQKEKLGDTVSWPKDNALLSKTTRDFTGQGHFDRQCMGKLSNNKVLINQTGILPTNIAPEIEPRRNVKQHAGH